jgi:hypothetical protein
VDDDGGPDREGKGLALLGLLRYSSYLIPPRSSMRLTFVNDLGQTYSVDIDPDMELENVMALLEAEVSCPPAGGQSDLMHLLAIQSGIPVNEQSISHEDGN